MRLGDLLTSVPCIVAVGLLGYLCAAALLPGWRWWERLAAAPGLATGIVGVVGLGLQGAHVGFAPATVVPVLGGVGLSAGLAWRRRAARRRRENHSHDGHRPCLSAWRERAIIAGALLAGLLSAAVAVVASEASPLPAASDAPIHAYFADAIARDHTFAPAQPVPVAGAPSTRPRLALEGQAAVVSWLGGPRPAAALVPLTLAAVLLLPLSLAMLALETTRDWRIAAAAPLLGVGLPFPFFPMALGEYPLAVDSTLIAPLVVLGLRNARGSRRRSAAAAGAMVLAIWVTHGLELLTVALLGACTILYLRELPWRELARRLATPITAAAAAALSGEALIHAAAAPAALTPVRAVTPTGIVFIGNQGSPGHVLDVLGNYAASVVVTPLAACLLVLGIVAALTTPRLRWALLVSGLLLLALADVGYLGILAPLWRRLYPWSVSDRLVSLQYWAAPVVFAGGAAAIPDLARRVCGAAHGPVTRAARAIVEGAQGRPRRVLATCILVASGALALSMRADYTAYDRLWGSVRVATSVDETAITLMDRRLAPGTVVLTNGDGDSGQWVDALSREVEYAPLVYQRSHYRGGEPEAASDDAYALARACEDPGAAMRALRDVQAVYVGARQLPGSTHPWRLDCISRLPGLRRIVDVRSGEGEAAAFVVSG